MFSFSGKNISLHGFLDFRVSLEKSAVILMALPSYVVQFFSLTDANILSFSELIALTMLCCGDVLFGHIFFGVLETLCTRMGNFS
jgi:hypothetical protein